MEIISEYWGTTCIYRFYKCIVSQQIGIPVYCMAMNPWKKQIVCGFNGAIRIYGLDESKFDTGVKTLVLNYFNSD